MYRNSVITNDQKPLFTILLSTPTPTHLIENGNKHRPDNTTHVMENRIATPPNTHLQKNYTPLSCGLQEAGDPPSKAMCEYVMRDACCITALTK